MAEQGCTLLDGVHPPGMYYSVHLGRIILKSNGADEYYG